MNIGWLTLLLLLPFVGAIATMLVPKAKALTAKQVALGFSLVTLVLTVIVAIGYQRNGAADYAETRLCPRTAAAEGHIDELIAPGETRSRLVWAFRSLERGA